MCIVVVEEYVCLWKIGAWFLASIVTPFASDAIPPPLYICFQYESKSVGDRGHSEECES